MDWLDQSYRAWLALNNCVSPPWRTWEQFTPRFFARVAIYTGSEMFLRTALVSVAARYANVSMRMMEQVAFSGISTSCWGAGNGISFPSSSATTSHPLATSVIISMASSIPSPVVAHPGKSGTRQ